MSTKTNGLIAATEADRWLTGLSHFDRQNEHVILCIMATFGIPASLLDVGSGDGAMVNMARRVGVDAYGIDILPREGWPYLIQHDLRQPYDFGRTFGMVTSIETAEHIAPEATDTFCDTVAKHLAREGLLVFSAAPPGQIGDGHVNCRPAYAWRDDFYKRGVLYAPDLTYRLALALSTCEYSMRWIEANVWVGVKRQ